MSHTSFLGIPVEGEITRGGRDRKEQRPIEELRPLIEAVLVDPFIVELGWRQYTPYFNDGEPCIFSVGTPWFRTTADTGGEEDYQLEMFSHPTMSGRRWNNAARSFDTIDRSPEVIASAERCTALGSAIEGGEFEDVLLDAFGDHATVVVRREGISIEFYEHD